MASAVSRTYLTPRQYLAIERKSEIRHEYHRGEVFAMAGASREHNLVALNIASDFRNQLRDRPCEVYISDMRVRVEATGLYTYPDVVVACGEPRFEDDEVDTLLNPTLIVEVLSPSTEAYDRGKKFLQYRTIPSLSDYVMVAQDEVRVEHYLRQDDRWVLIELNRPDQTFVAESLGCTMRVSEIYRKVEFDKAPSPAGQAGA